MLRLTAIAILAAICLCAAPALNAGSMSAPSGYTCIDTPVNMTANGYFGGFDLLPNTGPAIKKGITKAVIDQQPYLQGFYTVAQLALMQCGKFAAFDIDTGRGIVNPDNIDAVIDLAAKRIR